MEKDKKDLAKFILHPATQSVITLKDLSSNRWDVSPHELAIELQNLIKPIEDGDLSNAENMLMAQAHVLDTIFNTLCRMSLSKNAHINRFQYLDTALKTQKQFRNTIETLHVMTKKDKRTIKQDAD